MSCEARTCSSGKVLRAKSTFFSASVEQNERSQRLVRVSTPQRDNLFCLLFSGTIIVGLITVLFFSGFRMVDFGILKEYGNQRDNCVECRTRCVTNTAVFAATLWTKQRGRTRSWVHGYPVVWWVPWYAPEIAEYTRECPGV